MAIPSARTAIAIVYFCIYLFPRYIDKIHTYAYRKQLNSCFSISNTFKPKTIRYTAKYIQIQLVAQHFVRAATTWRDSFADSMTNELQIYETLSLELNGNCNSWVRRQLPNGKHVRTSCSRKKVQSDVTLCRRSAQKRDTNNFTSTRITNGLQIKDHMCVRYILVYIWIGLVSFCNIVRVTLSLNILVHSIFVRHQIYTYILCFVLPTR